jgi:protein SCO1/2
MKAYKLYVLVFIFNIVFILVKAENYKLSTSEIGIIEHLDEIVPDGIQLINEKNDTVDLKKIIDKPTVLCFVYFRCPMLCSPLMDGLSDVIDKSDMVIGKDYQVLTIGFNTAEPLSMAIEKKNNYIAQMANKSAKDGWKFFVSDSINIAKATQALGFRFKKTGKDFMHSATIIFISPQGKITRYLNGTYFLPFEFKMALLESSKGISGPTINKVLQYCYSFDSQANRYVLDVKKVAGSIIVLLLVIFFAVLALKPIFRKNK